jgi:hypothetical protein
MQIRSLGLAVAILAMTAGVGVAQAQTPAAAAAAGGFSTESSTIADLLASPAAKAVLEKHIPDIVSNPQISQAGTMTLKGIQQYAPDALTDDKLSKIDADLKKIPPAPKG